MTGRLVVIDADELRQLIVDAVAEALDADRASHVGAPALLDRAGLARALHVGTTTLDGLRSESGFPELVVGDSPRFQLASVLSWLASRAPTRASWPERRNRRNGR